MKKRVAAKPMKCTWLEPAETVEEKTKERKTLKGNKPVLSLKLKQPHGTKKIVVNIAHQLAGKQ